LNPVISCIIATEKHFLVYMVIFSSTPKKFTVLADHLLYNSRLSKNVQTQTYTTTITTLQSKRGGRREVQPSSGV